MRWPFVCITDPLGNFTGYVGVSGPIGTPEQVDTFERLRASVGLIGFTSYLNFPLCRSANRTGPDGLLFEPPDVSDSCIAWCHCFRSPAQYLPEGLPRLLLSESDFTDPAITEPPVGGTEKEFDFVYVCDEGWWKEFAKNWELARACLPVLCAELGLRGLLVGRERVADLPDVGPLLTVEPLLGWAELMDRFARSRVAFVPSGMDPSPRVLAEALCFDLPILVNKSILGGWKYVNNATGAFFSSPSDVADAMRSCLAGRHAPRWWFSAHYGPEHAGARLAGLLRSIDPELAGLRSVRLDYAADLEEVIRSARVAIA